MAYKLRVPSLLDGVNVFCPGCGHGIFYRIIHECIEELGYQKNNVVALGVGCGFNINFLTSGDKFQCPHG